MRDSDFSALCSQTLANAQQQKSFSHRRPRVAGAMAKLLHSGRRRLWQGAMSFNAKYWQN